MRAPHTLVLWLSFALASCGKYAGTAQQSGDAALRVQGKMVAMQLINYRISNGVWPSALSGLVREGSLPQEALLYAAG